MRLSGCRKTGLTIWPTIAIDDDRRDQREVAQPGERRSGRRAARSARAGLGGLGRGACPR